ncbi:hypothetical protein BKA70DRAFT_1225106 [Coprinopsis sp. MPI-PUGE-AT-0042]|nr:hypothetical protein BKA70DRAFT_1225106 [Coprinopsis sp. MPI-PUGE-AT-0042]
MLFPSHLLGALAFAPGDPGVAHRERKETLGQRRPTTFRIIDPGSSRAKGERFGSSTLASLSAFTQAAELSFESRETPPRSGRLPAYPLGSSTIGCETATLYTKRSSKVPWWSKWRSSQNTRQAKDNYSMNSVSEHQVSNDQFDDRDHQESSKRYHTPYSSWPEQPSQASKEFQPKEQWPHEASCLQIQKHQLSQGDALGQRKNESGIRSTSGSQTMLDGRTGKRHVVSLSALESDHLSILQDIEIAADAIWMHSFPPEIQRVASLDAELTTKGQKANRQPE